MVNAKYLFDLSAAGCSGAEAHALVGVTLRLAGHLMHYCPTADSRSLEVCCSRPRGAAARQAVWAHATAALDGSAIVKVK